MADLAITITNSVGCFGPSPSTRWNEFSWGLAEWGEGTLTKVKDVTNVILNSQPSTSAMIFDASISYSTDIDTDFSVSKESTLSIYSDFSFGFEMSEEGISDGSGYSYIFTRPTSDAETQVITTYSSGSAQNTSYTSGVTASTPWS